MTAHLPRAPLSSPLSGTLRLALALLGSGAALCAQTPQAVIFGDHAPDASGAALSALPDLDGDGLADVIVGAPGDGSLPATTVRIYSGATGLQLQRFVDKLPNALFGAAVLGLTDVNGDARPDLAVGLPGSAPFVGRVRVYSGPDGAQLLDLVSGLTDPWDGFGAALASFPDQDGDGAPELLIGAPSLSDTAPGSAFLRSGKTGAPLGTFAGLAAGDRFGTAVADAGDVNADGTPDVLVGAPHGLYAQVRSGIDGSVLLQLQGAGGDFGAAVAAAGDVNVDGYADVAVSSPGLNRVDVLSGLNGVLLRRYQRDTGNFGASIAPMGDVDGDGVMDFLIGAPLETIGAFANAGRVYAISGDVGTVLFKAPGAQAEEKQGAAVAVLAGPSPAAVLAVGAPGTVGPNGEASGATRLYAGKLVGAILPYGIGCPGSFLITPRIDLTGDPLPGAEVTLSITKALGGSYALLFLGSGQGAQALANGCILWVDPVLLAPITLPLVGPAPGTGTAIVTGRLPTDIPVGSVITMQAMVADPGADGGVASTNAIQLTVQ